MSGDDPASVAGGHGKLVKMFGPDIFADLKDKVVLDFGCGGGANTVELAKSGCAKVIGLDIQESHLEQGRRLAEEEGVADRCVFAQTWPGRVDVIVSTDAFEHFDRPDLILQQMRQLIKDDGQVLVEFGYTWYHPYGGHLFAVFPWAHLLFTEAALIRWRSEFKDDGARRFAEVAGGLNQMTVSHWERIVSESEFRFESYRLIPIQAARRLHCRATREFLTSTIRARLVPSKSV